MIESFLNYIKFEKRYSDLTVEAYRSDISDFSVFLKEEFQTEDILQMKTYEIRSWFVRLNESGLSERSINRKLASLRSFCKFLMQRGLIEENPISAIKSLKTQKTLPNFIPEENIVGVIKSLPTPQVSDFSSHRNHVMLELLYVTGMRRAELIGLKESDFRPKESIIKVLGKRNKERLIPLPKNFVKIISEYLSEKRKHFDFVQDDYLIVTDKGQKLYPMFVHRTINQLLDELNINKKSPHVLRHTAATHLLNNGAEINAVKDLLGHASLAATQVYTHNTLDKLKAAFDQAHPKA